jgi:hypothetical protein
VHDGNEGDEALAMVRDGFVTGVSMLATPLRSRTVDGVTERLRAPQRGEPGPQACVRGRPSAGYPQSMAGRSATPGFGG